jgi:hypothetical protein
VASINLLRLKIERIGYETKHEEFRYLNLPRVHNTPPWLEDLIKGANFVYEESQPARNKYTFVAGSVWLRTEHCHCLSSEAWSDTRSDRTTKELEQYCKNLEKRCLMLPF